MSRPFLAYIEKEQDTVGTLAHAEAIGTTEKVCGTVYQRSEEVGRLLQFEVGLH